MHLYIYDIGLQVPFFVFLLPFHLVFIRYVHVATLPDHSFQPQNIPYDVPAPFSNTFPPTHVWASHGLGSTDQFIQLGSPVIWKGASLPDRESFLCAPTVLHACLPQDRGHTADWLKVQDWDPTAWTQNPVSFTYS